MEQLTGFPPLSSKPLQALLTTKQFGRVLHVFDEIPSSNTYALKLAESGTPHGTLVLTECQTVGRGRLDRKWHSPKGTNIYCSIVLTQKPDPRFLSWIPLITGLSIVETVESYSKLRTSLKWPNDVLIEEKKLGGVLCESTQRTSQDWAVAVGIGINVNIEKEAFPNELRETATSFAIEGIRVIDRHSLVATLLNRLESKYAHLLAGHLSNLHAAYRSRCSTLGRQVRIHLVNGNLIDGHQTSVTMVPCRSFPQIIQRHYQTKIYRPSKYEREMSSI